ncbi:hypothetical protein SDC9_159660 [bioreactor metagenome]|uniref:Uncharacterized protein n=1 Tax=bioreactor metagenome TaxID=1076179 RepID=A0A645FIS3_9ZZZZ
MDAILEQFDALANDGVYIETGRVDLHLAGFDLGKVENVVDHPEQALAGCIDLGERIPGFHGVIDVAHADGGKAHDPVERGADFMAHVGDEFAARAGQLLGGPQRAFAGLVRRLLLAGVDETGDCADDFAVLGHRVGGVDHRYGLAVGPPIHFVGDANLGAGAQRAVARAIVRRIMAAVTMTVMQQGVG